MKNVIKFIALILGIIALIFLVRYGFFVGKTL